MQFVTLQFFVFFSGIFLLAGFLKESKKYYPLFLLAASLVFYSFFGTEFFFVLVVNIILNYLLLRIINFFGKKALIFSVVLNVGFLAIFKYYNFGVDTFLLALNRLQIPANVQVLRILIPVGISFYTFRNISHAVDCYRKELPVSSFIDYANYVAFFPQIMSGPIVRAKDFYTYLHNPRLFTYSQGRIITLILSGLVKKYVIASYLFDFTSAPFAAPTNYSSLDLVIAACAYSAMIFVDFSGYSDLAIAVANLLGFHVHRNFLSPYSAIGLRDFWNRWHISLSAWLRDYVYIPLGGSRKGVGRKYVNIIITMFVSGLWHGAGLTFVVWGLLHGVGSVVSHALADIFNRGSAKKDERDHRKIFEKYEVMSDSFRPSTNKTARGLFVDLDDAQFNTEFEQLFVEIRAELFKFEVSEAVMRKVGQVETGTIQIYPPKDGFLQTNLSANGKKIYIDTGENYFNIEIAESTEDAAPRFGKSMLLSAAKIFGWAVTFTYVTFTWIFFTSPSFAGALSYIGALFGSTVTEHKIFNLRLTTVIAVVLLFNFIGTKSFRFSINFFDKLPLPARIFVAATVAYAIIKLGPETMPPFIYFNF